MAKRFTDTNKFKKPFYRSLPAAYKILWDYLCHDCNHAGIWIVDFEIAQIYIGADAPINKNEALKYFNDEEDKVFEIDNGTRWFIPSFIEFQYGTLSKSNNVYKSIEKEFKKYNLFEYLNFEINDESTTISSKRNRVSKKLREQIFIDDDMTCQYCQDRKSKDDLVVDHIIPLNKNGSKECDNLITSCKRCNSHKTDIEPDIFINKSLEFLNPTDKLISAIKNLKGAYRGLQDPKDKDKDKDIDKDKKKEVNISFIIFWDLYDKKVGDKEKVESKWKSLSNKDRQSIIDYIPKYKESQPDKKYRKNPTTFLNNKSWNDEIIDSKNSAGNIQGIKVKSEKHYEEWD